MNLTTHIISTKDEYINPNNAFRSKARPDHDGVDIISATRKELKQSVFILAFADGIVTDTIVGSSIGCSVDIAHDGKLLTRYFHLKAGSVCVKVGQRVNKGDVIGIMGNTGTISPKPTPGNPNAGTHLHFGMKENSTKYNNGVYVNPMPYLLGEKGVATAGTKPAPPAPSSTAIEAGSKVRIKPTATVYATGQEIPERVKGKVYIVAQVNYNGEKILLKDIMSWVWSKDLVKV